MCSIAAGAGEYETPCRGHGQSSSSALLGRGFHLEKGKLYGAEVVADLGIGYDHRRFNELWEEEALHAGLCRVQPPQAAQLAPNFLQQRTGQIISQHCWDLLLDTDACTHTQWAVAGAVLQQDTGCT